MKTLIITLLLAAVLQTKAEDKIQLLRAGESIPQKPRPALLTNVIALFESASINSTAYAFKSETWDELLQSDTCVLVTFVPPRKLMVAQKPGILIPEDQQRNRPPQEKPIDQILVALPHDQLPGHIYARIGTNAIAVTKYSPQPLKQIAAEPALALSKIAPYAQLAALPASPDTP